MWLAEDRPLFAFPGLLNPRRGVRGAKSAEGEHELFGFLTTDADPIVAPTHPKDMPVIVTTPDGGRSMAHLGAPRRPRIVAKGERSDGVPASA